MTIKKSRKEYDDRTDIEKIESNWKKISGLYSRQEWSTVVVRAATTIEIAANLVIREELQVKRNLEEHFVNKLLHWANGIQGKFNRLILPILEGSPEQEVFKRIWKTKVDKINTERNLVAHSGQFKRKDVARKAIDAAKVAIETMVQQYKPGFILKNIDDSS